MRPEIAKLLPSQAKTTLTVYFVERLAQSPLDYRCHPTYTEEDAVREFFADALEWGFHRALVSECFRAAKEEYNLRYPLAWDNENQKAYRNVPRKA